MVNARAEVRDWRARLDEQSDEAHIPGACSANERAAAHGEPEALLKALGGRPVLRRGGERGVALEQASQRVGVTRADGLEQQDCFAERLGAGWADCCEGVGDHRKQLL